MKEKRRRLIARLLESRDVVSQEQLVDLLGHAGIDATQATVSRDLDQMGAVKRRRSGVNVYLLPAGGAAVHVGEGLRRMLAESVASVQVAAGLVVVKTPPGYAGMVAGALDRELLAGIAGTVAGDDTVLVACAQGVSSRDIRARLNEIAKL